ncbi:preprotein translocase subunit SecA [Flavonifractor plautii]|jgi:preprotein translocase subunit SecA|uniref:Protein translocase subunit SecA n=1 Tax=Flavonifractor plautii TaxID=292800 RepID=A0A174M7E5_FLAPL|nr:preprotein translocase subunit SecA [Flavonifractor plautii]EHO35098.1 preprotein translocase, SecA subunit [Lachnospiraceae bacterium 7_1_58FAA]MCB6873238.1 preprotein translocase subunit SecA [Flavonifractor plautii]MCB7359662.1 preprotein translocase subunit SecA [Flavonifractor plautii]MCI7151792.1 preprotein translocase subunit SecA [Flavonifractor plautii]MCQ4992463.1 preprotein translocase subunit SecA [Flavonifractor plautii]
MGLLKKLFGTSSEKELRAIKPIVDKIEALDGEYSKLTDEQLKAKTPEFKQRIANGESLDDILPEAFAACREAAWRVLGMKPYRVQLIGGIILHQGRIAEMKTGEGKTLVATLPAYLNALAGEGVHIVTVNDYLAKRDSEWMGKVYRFLGLTVGLVIHDIQPKDRKASYAADITYGTNNEFGFDYLRDNMAIYATEMVQRGHAFAIVDEVDSILIDEARTPLIISGQGDKSTQLYTVVDAFVAKLKGQRVASVDTKEEEDPDLDADYVVDEKARTVTLTARGIAKAEQQFQVANLADPENTTLSHHINQAIRARGLMRRDIDYVVKDGEVIIVDEFTGRLMYGRRYSEGLHQAIEAKEGVTVARESKTLATITFQNYFRLYGKLSGMTGTAMTEEEEFGTIYSLDIVEIPTNKPVQRVDHPDVVYKTEAGKFRAIVNQIEECHKKGQPVLVGTISIEKSEELSAMLKKRGIRHNVLNAKFHEKEAEIVAQAGKLGAVTVATNMAGRGTDIMLGGNAEYLAKAELRKAGLSDELIAESTGYADTDNEEILNARKMFAEAEAKYKDEIKAEADQVRAAGGLFILGTERHESRRIDNQLRGRAGRQGDPGESRFYLSLEDDIMRLFGSERVMGMMEKLGVDEDTPIDAKILSNAIENAQKQVESRNFQTRKTVLEYDDVMNTQRKVIYEQRRKVLDGENLKESVQTMLSTVISTEVQAHMGELKHMDAENWREVCAQFRGLFLRPDEFKFTDEELQQYDAQALTDLLQERASDIYARKEAELGEPLMRELERVMMLRVVDEYWMDNIDAMQELRQGIGLRAYGQNDPVVAYKKEGYEMFESMIAAIQAETIRRIFLARVQVGATTVKRERVAKVTGESAGSDGTVKKQPVKKGQKVGRNDPCPCGSGKKYKKCCGMHEDE